MICSQTERVTEAYLSGDIDQPAWRKHLDACPECCAKLKNESDFDHLIRHAVTSERLQTRQLEVHVRAAMRESVMPIRPPSLASWRYGIAAAVALFFVVIATVGYAIGRIERTAVCIDAADDHQEEVVAKSPRKWRTESGDVQALAQRIVGDPSVPERIVPAGYRLVGARVCLLHGKRYMHLDYSDGSNEISLFVRHQDTTKPLLAHLFDFFQLKGPSTERVDAFAVGSVQKDHLSLVLVSSAPIPEAEKIVAEAGGRL
jgi:anti-sigma factor RsiW